MPQGARGAPRGGPPRGATTPSGSSATSSTAAPTRRAWCAWSASSAPTWCSATTTTSTSATGASCSAEEGGAGLPHPHDALRALPGGPPRPHRRRDRLDGPGAGAGAPLRRLGAGPRRAHAGPARSPARCGRSTCATSTAAPAAPSRSRRPTPRRTRRSTGAIAGAGRGGSSTATTPRSRSWSAATRSASTPAWSTAAGSPPRSSRLARPRRAALAGAGAGQPRLARAPAVGRGGLSSRGRFAPSPLASHRGPLALRPRGPIPPRRSRSAGRRFAPPGWGALLWADPGAMARPRRRRSPGEPEVRSPDFPVGRGSCSITPDRHPIDTSLSRVRALAPGLRREQDHSRSEAVHLFRRREIRRAGAVPEDRAVSSRPRPDRRSPESATKLRFERRPSDQGLLSFPAPG